MKKIQSTLFFLLLVSLHTFVYSQMKISKEFQKSYNKGFRQMNGTPGEAYFSNFSDYKIEVSFNPETAFLQGKESISYHNNSADTLKTLVFKIVQNIFKEGSKRDFTLTKEDIHSGVKIQNLSINGQSYNEDSYHSQSVMSIQLINAILPHSVTKISLEWNYTYPQKSTIRAGKYADKTFFIGYWYPQIAVYDDVFGWDKIPHTGWQEFYNEHSNYEVSITVPYPNIVWATGRLQNAQKVFQKTIVERYNKALRSDEVVHIISQEEKGLLLNTEKNTFVFKADKVPDFAFSTSDHYLWDAVRVKQNKGEDVFVSAAYTPHDGEFDDMASLSSEIIKYFANEIPGIPFPYPSMTVFNGGGAMEYPMMVNLWQFKKTCDKVYVVAHEIGHTYFPFATGTNETVYAWMDEGLVNYFPRYAANSIAPGCSYFEYMIQNYMSIAGSHSDIPILTPSSFVHERKAYRQIAYNHPAYAFYELTQYVGEKAFFGALQDFFKTWRGKHPYPHDFFNSFNTSLNQNLDWFWKPYFEMVAYPDLKITDASYENRKLTLEIENVGGLPLTTKIYIETQSGETVEFTEKLSVWKGKKQISLTYPVSQVKKITLGDELHPDINLKGNTWIFDK